jgi:hypothetical protein
MCGRLVLSAKTISSVTILKLETGSACIIQNQGGLKLPHLLYIHCTLAADPFCTLFTEGEPLASPLSSTQTLVPGLRRNTDPVIFLLNR